MNKNQKPKNKRSSEMKHTEGQWVVQNPHYKTGVRVSKKITKGSAGKIHYQYASIADITKGEFDGEQEANANLIASAPEMLEMLKYISKLNKHNGGMYQMFSNIMGSDPAHEIGNKLLSIIAWAEEGR